MFRRGFSRHGITIVLLVCFSVVFGVIIYAVLDIASELRRKEQLVRTASLKTELAQFVLGLREDDGFPLLDNVDIVSREVRPLRFLRWNRPLFSYFLHQGNARTFNAQNLKADPPPSCVVEFVGKNMLDSVSQSGEFRVTVCLSVVPNDATGRYLYFSVQYPNAEVVRHIQGQDLKTADKVVLSITGERTAVFELVMEDPKGSRLYPARPERFKGFHDVTAYSLGTPWQPARGVNAQAFERSVVNGEGQEQNVLLIAGRIDAALIFPMLQATEAWPPAKLRNTRVGIDILDAVAGRPSAYSFRIAPDASGTTRRSLERLYAAHIASKATLDLNTYSTSDLQPRLIWSSTTQQAQAMVHRDFIQRVSDWLAGFLSGKPEHVRDELKVEGRPGIVATIEARQVDLPEITARAFLYVSVAAFFLLAILAIAGWTSIQLATITRRAYAMAVRERNAQSFQDYTKLPTEIGTLARTFEVLLRRSRSRAKKLNRLKQAEIRVAHERLKVKQSLLDAIGHEIKSPLQTLSTRTAGSELAQPVQRMVRAVEALYEATSIEAAFREGKILCKSVDMASFLHRFTENLQSEGWPIRYFGPDSGLVAFFDPISFETVVDHLLSNARRKMWTDTEISITLNQVDEDVTIDIHNLGPRIPEGELEAIFNLGFSTELDPQNLGLGLFAVRSYVAGMNGTVVAKNHPLGVSFVITLPRRAPIQ